MKYYNSFLKTNCTNCRFGFSEKSNNYKLESMQTKKSTSKLRKGGTFAAIFEAHKMHAELEGRLLPSSVS